MLKTRDRFAFAGQHRHLFLRSIRRGEWFNRWHQRDRIADTGPGGKAFHGAVLPRPDSYHLPPEARILLLWRIKGGSAVDRLFVWIPVLGATLLALFAGLQPWAEPRLLFADPLIAAEEAAECCSVYYGIMSTLGVFMWIGTAVLCGFTALVLLRANPRRADMVFLVAAGAFSAWLGFDDAFMFHESVAPALGIPQKAVLLVYVGLAAAYAWSIRRRVFSGRIVLLGAAFAGFAASVGIDVFTTTYAEWVVVAEDVFKFAGIAAWFMFHLASALDILAPEPAAGRAEPS